MVFLFIMPMLLSFVGNWTLPQSYLALDFAVPRINLASFFSLLGASCLLILALSREEGVSAGWTLYAPLSDASFHSSSSITLAILALHILGLSSEGGSITFLVSVFCSRMSGTSSISYCLLTWSIVTASVVLILTLPVLGSGITLLLLDRVANTVFLNPQLSGDPVLFQHLFWYFGHPEVYVIVLPAFGLVSAAIIRSTHLAVASHLGMILAILSIGLVGFFVWAHHMFVAGISEDARLYFSSATMIIGIPTATKIFAWATSATSAYIVSIDLLLVTIFLVCFTMGGFTGLVLSNAAIDILYHDTYYVVGHFHYVLSIAAAIGVLLVLRTFSTLFLAASGTQILSRFALLMLISGVNWLFLTQHIIGIDGHPRRIFNSSEMHHITSELANLAIPAILFGMVLLFVSAASATTVSTTPGYLPASNTTSALASTYFLSSNVLSTTVHEV